MVYNAGMRAHNMKFLCAFISLFALGANPGNCNTDKNKDPDIEPTGSRYNHTWINAPKVIESKEITSFRYKFCFSSHQEWDKRDVPYFNCSFWVDRDGKQAHCRGWCGLYEGFRFEFDFKTSLSILDDLQKIMDAHDVASVNGIAVGAYGLPPDVGSNLDVIYASGERIYSADSSGQILREKVNMDIHDFFIDLAKKAGAKYDF